MSARRNPCLRNGLVFTTNRAIVWYTPVVMNAEETNSIERITTLPELPARPDDAHKGSFGRVLIAAGSRGMSGAASLAGLGALRGGAGLVYVAAPAGIVPIIAAVEPSYLTIPLPEDTAGRLSGDAGETLESLAAIQSAIAIGPGWGQSDELSKFACRLYAAVQQPMVVDADALNALAKHPDVLSSAKAERILTPHPGEFARLTGSNIETVQANREEMVIQFARKHNIVLLLKGSGTVITDGHRLAINDTGNSGMATGGAGDVLTGLIAALLAQGMPAFEAAQLAAHLHGLAGDLAADALSQPGLIASDLPRYLALAWKRFDSLYGEPF
jgi:ADP-dependent NAD(P)H-hydrate dehydratase